jgi:hypothetical protein
MDAVRPQAAPLSTFLVERYWPGVTVELFDDAARRVQQAIEALRAEGSAIRTVASTLVPGDEAAYWVVEATSAELVAQAWQAAGVPIERIVSALEGRGTPGPPHDGLPQG